MSNLDHHLSESKGVELLKGDVRDRAVLSEAFRGADVIFHLAVRCLRLSFREPDVVHEVNATGTFHALQAALECKVARFVYVSSSEVYGTAVTVPMKEDHPLRPTTVYGASKLAGEHYAMAYFESYGLPAMVVRPFNTYGPRAHFEGAYGEVIPRFTLRALGGKEPIVFGDGAQTRDFTYVTDIVEGICLAATKESLLGNSVNIARGEEVAVAKLAELILETAGRDDLRPIFDRPRPADVARHWADIGLARKSLGFEPRVGIKDGLRQYVSWVKGQDMDLEHVLATEELYNW
jgi:UDP-glucose 4-epimerase